MEEVIAKPDGKDKAAIDGVLKPHQRQGTGALVGQGKYQPARHAEQHRYPVLKEDVREAECDGACREHQPWAREQWRITCKEERTEHQLLGNHRQQGIEQHDHRPYFGAFGRKAQEARGLEMIDRGSDNGRRKHKTAKDGFKVAPCEGGAVPHTADAGMMVAMQHPIAIERQHPQHPKQPARGQCIHKQQRHRDAEHSEFKPKQQWMRMTRGRYGWHALRYRTKIRRAKGGGMFLFALGCAGCVGLGLVFSLGSNVVHPEEEP